MHDLVGPVSLTRAAELLTAAGDKVERSTLSRYVAQHADALSPGKRGRETVVDFETLKKHRQENVRLDLAAPGPPAGAAPPLPSTPLQQSAQDRSGEAAANLRVQRQLRQIELGKELGLLILKSEAEDAASSAVSALRSAFALALNETADTIAAVTRSEARLIRPHLRSFEKKGLEQFIRVIADYGLLPDDGKGAQGEPSLN